MPRRSFVIFASDTTWRIGALEADAPRVAVVTPPDDDAATAGARELTSVIDRVVRTLGELGYRGEPVVLAIPGPWCLAASIATEGLPRRHRRQAMLYRFEEKLPVAAEDLTADFVTANGHALGVGVRTEPIQRLIVALESRGVTVQAIVPAPLLALQHVTTTDEHAAGVVVWQSYETLDVLTLSQSRLVRWRSLPVNVESLRLCLRNELLHTSQQHLTLHAYGPSDELIDLLRGEADLQFEATAVDQFDAATHGAAAILAAKRGPWVNLRRDALAARDPNRLIRRPLTATLLAAAVCLAGMIGVMHVRADNYRQIAHNHEQQQRQLYRRAFPHGSAPPNVKLRLQSEALTLRRKTGDTGDLPAQPSALRLLHDALSRLPTDRRIRVLELRLDGRRLVIEGQARSHSDADAVAAALRARRGFDIEPPRTEHLRDGKGVSFTITGAAAAQTEPTLAAAGDE